MNQSKSSSRYRELNSCFDNRVAARDEHARYVWVWGGEEDENSSDQGLTCNLYNVQCNLGLHLCI
jgi:hypothetical protein